MLKQCELESPDGQKLMKLAIDAMHDAFHVLVRGAPGRRLEDCVFYVRGIPAGGDRYVAAKADLVDLSELPAVLPVEGDWGLADLVPPGHVTVCAEAEGRVLLALRPWPAQLEDLRRLESLSAPSMLDLDDLPGEPRPTEEGSPSPILNGLLVDGPARVREALRSAARMGMDLSITAVIVSPGGDDSTRSAPKVELADRPILAEEFAADGMVSAGRFAHRAGHVPVVYLAPDGIGVGQVEIPVDDERPKGSFVNVGRNDRCPCGSGKKYKRCCIN